MKIEDNSLNDMTLEEKFRLYPKDMKEHVLLFLNQFIECVDGTPLAIEDPSFKAYFEARVSFLNTL